MAYSLANVLTASPEKVKVTILAVGGVACALAGLQPTLLETVGVGIAVERLLDLFYVAPQVAANRDDAALQAIDLGKQLAPRRPLRAPPAGPPPAADPPGQVSPT